MDSKYSRTLNADFLAWDSLFCRTRISRGRPCQVKKRGGGGGHSCLEAKEDNIYYGTNML
jgi:hypothetical protein